MADTRKARVDKYELRVKEIQEVLRRLDRGTLLHLDRASFETSRIDGFSPGAVSSEIRSSTLSDPAGNGAVARAEDVVRIDPVANALAELFTSLVEMHGHSKIINKKIDVVIHAGSRVKDETSTDICQACQRVVACTPNDRLRAKYCSGCYTAWDREGRPDRMQFENRRYQVIAESA